MYFLNSPATPIHWCCCWCCAAQVHVMTHHALCAFREGRVMLWGRRIGIQYTDEKTCGRGVESWLCHLRPPSSCTLEQVSLAVAPLCDGCTASHPV